VKSEVLHSLSKLSNKTTHTSISLFPTIIYSSTSIPNKAQFALSIFTNNVTCGVSALLGIMSITRAFLVVVN